MVVSLRSALIGITLQLPLAISGQISDGWFNAVLLLCVLMSAAELLCRRRERQKTAGDRSVAVRRGVFSYTWLGDLPPLIRLFVLMYVTIFLWFAAIKPCITFDARSIFGLKARILDDGGNLAGEDFRDPDRLNFNANYPLFVPVVEATLSHTRGSQDAIGLQLLFAGFVLATASILAAEVRRFDSPQSAALWASAFVLLPMTLSPTEGGGMSGSVDYAVAAFATAAVIATGRWIAEPNWRTALLAGVSAGSLLLIKQEGQIWILAMVIAFGGTAILRRKTFTWRSLPTSLAAIFPVVGCVALAVVNRRGISESPYFRSFGQAMRWEWLVQLGKRPWFLIQFAIRDIASPRGFGFCWPLIALTLVLLRRPRITATVLFWRLTAAAVIAGYFLVLTITPLHFEYQLRTALFRLAVHFLPLVLLVGAEQLAAAGFTRQVHSIFRGEDAYVAPQLGRLERSRPVESIAHEPLPDRSASPDETPATVRAA